MLCFVPVLRGCVWYVCCSPMPERRDMGLNEVPLSMSLFGIRTIFANFHICGIMLLLRVV